MTNALSTFPKVHKQKYSNFKCSKKGSQPNVKRGNYRYQREAKSEGIHMKRATQLLLSALCLPIVVVILIVVNPSRAPFLIGLAKLREDISIALFKEI